MTGFFDRLRPRSITAQITGIVAISVLLGMALTIGIVVYLSGMSTPADTPRFLTPRIIDGTRTVQAAKTTADADIILAALRRAGIRVERVPLSALVALPDDVGTGFLYWSLTRHLDSEPGIHVLERVRYPGRPKQQVVVQLDAANALVFDAIQGPQLWRMILTPTALLLMIVLVFVLLLSAYAVRWIIAPLNAVAAAALSFGRSPRDDQAISRRGPREIVQVADALNDMRTRIRALLEDRTRMLAAISHDLRTPLTRLRLRVERVGEDALRDKMLGDLTTVGRMLDETLDYLRENGKSEATARADLPSILQTICWDFADVGHDVSYLGPTRLAWTVRPRSLTRAVTNIVENGVKHGGAVTVALASLPQGGIEIRICDNGPGIPAALREKVFEPFFKADDARTQGDGGFGLGLSIARDIVKQHGGEIELRPGDPGLAVRILLPAGAMMEKS
jgi:signal transduction histidine kinase